MQLSSSDHELTSENLMGTNNPTRINNLVAYTKENNSETHINSIGLIIKRAPKVLELNTYLHLSTIGTYIICLYFFINKLSSKLRGQM